MRYINTGLLATLLFFSIDGYSIEITPIAGLRAGGDFTDETNNKKHTIVESEFYGLILSFPHEYGKTIDIYYSHQSSKLRSVSLSLPSTSFPTDDIDLPLTIDYLHVGGTTPIEQYENMKTYVSGGLGFTYLNPDLGGLDSDIRPSFSIGIGMKWPITDNIALRLETRGLATMFNNDTSVFCSGGCALEIKGEFFVQGEAFAGLAIRF
ncbi:MAG TPA: hypothetical protein ENJ87_01275 [Gammaproteobacteria bacterium]|nr:hypothetical protein [Gammaproteobacteria bacterium]